MIQTQTHTMTNEKIKCSLCGEDIEPKGTWIYGNNAQPLSDGRCCDFFNETKVIPERIRRFREKK